MAYDADRRPGTWVSKQALRKGAYVWLLAAILIALAVLAVGLVLANRATVASSLAIIVGAIVLKRLADRRADEAIHWLGGARAETSVGEELNQLRYEGFVVMHDIEQPFEGNIDHLVSGPSGVFMIETKRSGYAAKDLLKAKRQAAKVHDELGVWVTPAICIHRRRGAPFRDRGVWILPSPSLLDWIRNQRNKPVEFDRLAIYADRL